ncbi:hypothetical protein [Cytobacillus sp. IB215665]|nr:hypothetical protein [Cytobacillus sp. IB215665]MDX8368014.1 hypothetical protein [Cytobacillus sp. IB215665]
MSNNMVEVYHVRAVGFHGEVVLIKNQDNPTGEGEVAVSFT